MDRITCPTCQTSYPFTTLGVQSPAGPDVRVDGMTKCAVCKTLFTFTLTWRPVKVAHVDSWFRRIIQRKPAHRDYNMTIDVQTRVK